MCAEARGDRGGWPLACSASDVLRLYNRYAQKLVAILEGGLWSSMILSPRSSRRVCQPPPPPAPTSTTTTSTTASTSTSRVSSNAQPPSAPPRRPCRRNGRGAEGGSRRRAPSGESAQVERSSAANADVDATYTARGDQDVETRRSSASSLTLDAQRHAATPPHPRAGGVGHAKCRAGPTAGLLRLRRRADAFRKCCEVRRGPGSPTPTRPLDAHPRVRLRTVGEGARRPSGAPRSRARRTRASAEQSLESLNALPAAAWWAPRRGAEVGGPLTTDPAEVVGSRPMFSGRRRRGAAETSRRRPRRRGAAARGRRLLLEPTSPWATSCVDARPWRRGDGGGDGARPPVERATVDRRAALPPPRRRRSSPSVPRRRLRPTVRGARGPRRLERGERQPRAAGGRALRKLVEHGADGTLVADADKTVVAGRRKRPRRRGDGRRSEDGDEISRRHPRRRVERLLHHRHSRPPPRPPPPLHTAPPHRQAAGALMGDAEPRRPSAPRCRRRPPRAAARTAESWLATDVAPTARRLARDLGRVDHDFGRPELLRRQGAQARVVLVVDALAERERSPPRRHRRRAG